MKDVWDAPTMTSAFRYEAIHRPGFNFHLIYSHKWANSTDVAQMGLQSDDLIGNMLSDSGGTPHVQ